MHLANKEKVTGGNKRGEEKKKSVSATACVSDVLHAATFHVGSLLVHNTQLPSGVNVQTRFELRILAMVVVDMRRVPLLIVTML
jgi:hypothetical protein